MRFYFWLKGVSEDRPGGPWWTREFTGPRHEVDRFKADLLPFLHAYAITSLAIEVTEGECAPPPSAIQYVKVAE